MSRRKRTLFGTRSNRSDTVEPIEETEKPLPLAAWSQVDLPPRPDEQTGEDDEEDPDAEITEGPELEDTEPPSSAQPEPDAASPVPEEDAHTDPAGETPVPDDELVGARIGQWTVKGLIGKGDGYSLVRVTHHQSSRMKATLKVLEAQTHDDARARDRLVREGEILFPLDHPTIANVRNLMLTHDPPFLEFQQLRGERLDGILARRRSLFMAEALDLAEQLLGTLVYLHERRVYHLDLQPRNIMVRPDGVITVIGFSNAVEREAPVEDAPFGALPYLAPEWPTIQWPGLVDLYATGALLYELLTGQRPFGAPLHGGSLTVALVLNDKARAPFLDPGGRFQEDLRAVVRHLTTREPAGRLADPADALSRLQAVERSYAT